MKKRVSIKTINKNKTRKTLLNVFMLAFIMFIVGVASVYALSYTVSYNNNGGTGTMSNSTFTSNPGTNLVKVYGRSQIVYISSGTITISSGSSVVVS